MDRLCCCRSPLLLPQDWLGRELAAFFGLPPFSFTSPMWSFHMTACRCRHMLRLTDKRCGGCWPHRGAAVGRWC
eukprot:1194955-Prorocentrum_minimum.AAC.1